ncbi:MAG: methyl-accepting chemotaxis protein [Gammaproteobacteria bacterium]|nr:methyl-accepting chemotaxis protein [Gammaproteobacteria bacterium]MDH5801850.1 methyl-accepting chemotaxis protein [Gammaproteobacteria bacterium]
MSSYEKEQYSANSDGLLFLCLVVGLFFAIVGLIVLTFVFGDAPQEIWLWLLCGGVVGGLALGAVFYFLFNNLYLKKLHDITAVLKAVSQSDLSQRCDVQQAGPLGGLAAAVNNMVSNLNANILHIANAAVKVSELSRGAGSFREPQPWERRSHRAGKFDFKPDLSRREGSYSRDPAANRELLPAGKETASGLGRSDLSLSDNDLEKTEEFAGNMAKAGSVIEKLEQESQNIGVVLEVIQGIAEQTNLLALNAQVEAAKSGEQGRGFAVVANEVRTLATKTEKSTKEIKSMVDQLQSGASSAVKAMTSAQKKTRGMVKHAEQSVKEASDAVSTINEINAQIVQSVKDKTLDSTRVRPMAEKSKRPMENFLNELLGAIQRFKLRDNH